MSKIKQILTILSFVPVLCQAQSNNENYVQTITMLEENCKSSIPAVQYYNGLGYPTVSVGKVGGDGQTAYSLTTYDALGREEYKYIPVVIGNTIDYKAPGTIKSASKSSDGYNDTKAYSRKKYDVLDRPLSVTMAGTAFSGHYSCISYLANKANEVIRYVVSGNSITKNKYYPKGSLTKETGKDPDGNTVVTFKDIFGNIILQRANDGKMNLDTYYVYDNLGRLRFVLPPRCKSLSPDSISAFGYEYRYDDRGRVVHKKLPGASYCEYWYDNTDRMICYRDAEMRKAGKMRFFVYDKFDRMVVQGMCTSCLRDGTIHSADFSTSENGLLGTGYVMSSEFLAALKNAQLETANYYNKNQDNIRSGSDKKKYFSDIKINTSVSQIGQLTGTLTAASNGEFVASLMVYDIKGNLTNSRTKELGGRITSNETKYSFTNKVKFSETYIAMSYGESLIVTENWKYNPNIDKKSSYSLTLNHGDKFTNSVSYNYNKLGQLSIITRPIGTAVYTYDMHGWLKSIKTNSFTEELFYADGPASTKSYNGNISSLRWKDYTSSTKRGYMFTYDKANRMLNGIYGEGDNLTANSDRYTEKMTYDENGNIKTVTRYGKTGTSSYGLMDNLTVTYNGNQPSKVSETAADYNYSGSFEYKKANGSGYKFNKSGALIADKNRGIAYITYDFNNNPEKIYFTNGSMTKYVYSASGQKLRTVHYTAKPNITRTWGTKPADPTATQTLSVDSTDYVLGGSLVIKNGKIDKYLFEGGYAQASVADKNKGTDKFAFNYYNQDHLGNIREVVDAKGVVQQVTNYYPSGVPYTDATASKGADVQPYKYNGKELDRMHGLDTYDYGARQYDPVLGRWDRIDPLCEKYYSISPYAYCMNNPVRLVDPNGKDVTIIYTDENGKTQNFIFDGTQSKCPNNSYVLAFIKTYNFLKSKGLGKNLVKAVTNHKYNIKLQNDDDGYGNGYDPETNHVFWNPNYGLKLTNGGRHSAAVGLEHEFDHAVDYNDDKDGHLARQKQYDPQYENAEERRVIEGSVINGSFVPGSERLTATALNEGIRHDHKGDYYMTILPTSTKEGIPHNFTRSIPVPNKPSLIQFIENLFH